MTYLEKALQNPGQQSSRILIRVHQTGYKQLNNHQRLLFTL